MSGPEERKVQSLARAARRDRARRATCGREIEARLEGAAAAAAPPAPRARAAQLRWLAAAAMVASVAVGVWIGRDLVPLGAPRDRAAGGNEPLTAMSEGARGRCGLRQ